VDRRPERFCASIGTDEHTCNQGNVNGNNIGDFYFPCQGADIVCGTPLFHQQCFFSGSKHTCEPGANETILLGCQ
jgi:hypothetical protein